MLTRDVLDALHNGENLCPRCLGKKYIVILGMPDFAGDKEYNWNMKCPKCDGKGLE